MKKNSLQKRHDKDRGEIAKEVRQYEQLKKKVYEACEAFGKVRDHPVVKAYLESLKPKPSEDDRKRSALSNLYDSYRLSADYISETISLLCEIEGNGLDLPAIDSTLNRLVSEMNTLDKICKEAFRLGGIDYAKPEESES